MKHTYRRLFGIGAAVVALAGCVQPPVAPMIPVAPGPNKSFEAFGTDQMACQQYAAAQTAPAVAAANNQTVGTAVLITALGAGLGAAAGSGGWHSHAARGAGIGAASGAVVGTALGAGQTNYAQMSIQQQYDVLYANCMIAHGNQLPGFSPPPDAPRYPGGPTPPGPQPYSSGPPGYGPPGYGPPGYGPPGYPGAPVPPPSGYSPSGYAPSGY
jgi:hypothetical protein